MTICLSKVWMLLVTQAAVAFLLLLSSSFSPCLLRRPFFLLSPSSSWGACAGLPRPYLGWCPSVGVRVLLATSLPLLLLLSSFFFLLLFRPVFFVVLSSFCLPPLLGVHVLVYHVLTWGGVPVSGCVCCWPRPFPLLPLLLFLLLCPVSFCLPPLLGVRVLVYHVLTWGGVTVSGCMCCWPRPFFFFFFFFFFLLFRPVFFVVLSSFCLPPLLGVCVLVYHVLTWGGVPVSGCVCCWPRPFLFCFFCFFFFLFFFVLSLSVSLLFLGCVCWFTTSWPGVVPQFRGACVAGHVPSSSASFSSSSFSPCLLRRPFSSFCLLPLLGCVRWFTTSWPGVVSQCRGACVAGHVPSSSSFSSSSFLLLFRPVFFFVLSSFCLPPLLGVRVLVYHVLTWGGVPVSGCVCCWPRPFLFCFFCFFFFLFFFVLSLSVYLLFLGCVCWLTTFLITWGCVPVSGCVCCWKQHLDLGVVCGGFPQGSNVFWLPHSITGQGSFLLQSLGITLLVVKQIWIGLLMRRTALLLILLQYGQNFGLWKVPLLVVFSVQVMFLMFPHGHPSLVNFLPAKISLTGPLGWAEGLLRLGPTSSTWNIL